MRCLLPLLLCLLCLACQEEPKAPADPPAAPPPAPVEQPVETAKPTLPSLPVEKLEYFSKHGTQIDYMFHNLPISMSQDNPNDLRGALGYISTALPVRRQSCQPIGMVFYETKEGTHLQGNIYFTKGCTYFEFLENGKIAYANQLTPQGIEFFNTMLTRIGQPAVQ